MPIIEHFGQPQVLTLTGTDVTGTAILTNITNTLTFQAIDMAGNTTTITRTVILDQESPIVSIVSPLPDAEIAGIYTVRATAEDSLSGIATVALFIDNEPKETRTTPPYQFELNTYGFTAGSHTITLRAVDVAGNTAETSILVTVPAQLAVDITSPTEGVIINKSTTIIKGKMYTAPGKEIGVTINGLLAQVNGTGFVAVIPLQQGQNTVSVAATSEDGLTANATISINAEISQELVGLSAAPVSGIVMNKADGTTSFDTTLTAEAYLPNAIVNYFWDTNGDGVPELIGQNLSTVKASYQTPGIYYPTVTVVDALGNSYTETIVVNVLDKALMDALLKAKWEGMKGALVNGEIDRAVSYFAESSQEIFKQRFTTLTPYLPQIVSDMSGIRIVYVREWLIEYDLRTIRNNDEYSFQLLFMIDRNGLWKIRSF